MKFKETVKKILPSKRKLIQLYSALLFNANLKGFGNGKIYQGPLKNICTPGLNCYSCPGASGASVLYRTRWGKAKSVPPITSSAFSFSTASSSADSSAAFSVPSG